MYQGDYSRVTQFSEDPLDVAVRWQAMGAPRLHIVDLDGAALGRIGNAGIIADIAKTLQIPTQLGGGIRDLETIDQVLRMGIDRVILGTVAVEDPQLIAQACRQYNDYIIVSIDARDGIVSTHGWQKDTQLTTIDLAKKLVQLGVKRFIYTDIVRDGTLTEPNFAAVSDLMAAVKKPVIAAGGVTSVLHLKMLAQLGAEGGIIGRALYTGDINLKEALAVING